MASGLRLTYMSKLDMHSLSLIQSKGHSGLATFYGTGFGIFGWEKDTQDIMISSKKEKKVMHLKNVTYQSQITITESQ